MQDDPITTVDELVERLGGPKQTASFFNEARPTVRKWLERGQMPSRLYLRHCSLLDAAGLNVSHSVWGMAAPRELVR